MIKLVFVHKCPLVYKAKNGQCSHVGQGILSSTHRNKSHTETIEVDNSTQIIYFIFETKCRH